MVSHEPQQATAVPAAGKPTQAPAERPKHPRRPPAAQSVSLLHPGRLPARQQSKITSHSLSPQNSQAPQSDRANPPSSPSSLKPRNAQYSSGESSDAGKWFENSNNNIRQNNQFTVDNDPPFFLRNSSSSSTPPDAIQDGSVLYPRHPTSATIPYRLGLMINANDSSSTEDYRSVIDDLTVANKKLKKRLRKYEKLYDAHLQGDKLFEVRVHGLPPKKKKELEDYLKKFAIGMGNIPSTESPSNSDEHIGATLEAQNTTASSHTSRVAESGYASMSLSLSGQNSSAQSNHDNAKRKGKSNGYRQRPDIQSYLRDIPAGLLPKHTTAMTEKSKKKLVVRRLEQVFAGKGAVGAHSQPLQQQEVAQSAAAADKEANEASGQRSSKEGLREARILPTDDKRAMAISDMEPGTREAVHQIKAADHRNTGHNSPNQRPTRPLDLDPYRAQVPMENMNYFRHLGFSPPDPDSSNSPEEGRGWIYLNLLINMAQLHTINVTTEFVKDSIKDYSDNIELSHDGRKIRWKGGHDITHNSSDTSSDPNSGISPDSRAPSLFAKRSKKHKSESGESRGVNKSKHSAKSERDKFSYTPLFFHKESSEAEESSALGPSSISSPMPARDSGFTSSGDLTHNSRRRADDGPIIFYNRANFCTDLSGDVKGTPTSSMDPSKYQRSANLPIGEIEASKSAVAYAHSSCDDTKGSLFEKPIDDDAMEISEESSVANSSLELDFLPDSTQVGEKAEESPANYQFEASGIGGVEPRDNFAIYVVSKQSRGAEGSGERRQSSVYPPKLRSIIEEALFSSSSRPSNSQKSAAAVSKEIISTTHKPLPVSALPPASFLPFTSSSDDTDSDLESEVSEASIEPSVLSQQHPIAPQLLNYPFDDYSDEDSGLNSETDSQDLMNEDEDEDEDDEEESVDFLATARELDPETIMAREREYDANMAERIAEEIPAGSSAATAGGGSGFNSPASHTAEDSLREAASRSSRKLSTSSGDSQSRKSGLKRTRTSDSLVVHGKAPKIEKLK